MFSIQKPKPFEGNNLTKWKLVKVWRNLAFFIITRVAVVAADDTACLGSRIWVAWTILISSATGVGVKTGGSQVGGPELCV